VDELIKDNLRSTLTTIFENNSQVLMISLTSPEGLPILLMERKQDLQIEEIIDSGISNRYAALAGASTSLGDRTLSTLGQENVRLIHVLGANRDIAISVTDSLIALVVTHPNGSANLLADKLTNTLKLQI
jgi:predicted regulator of Ras-like GTPase activity (Roadblock/LC7/MglB family)